MATTPEGIIIKSLVKLGPREWADLFFQMGSGETRRAVLHYLVSEELSNEDEGEEIHDVIVRLQAAEASLSEFKREPLPTMMEVGAVIRIEA